MRLITRNAYLTKCNTCCCDTPPALGVVGSQQQGSRPGLMLVFVLLYCCVLVVVICVLVPMWWYGLVAYQISLNTNLQILCATNWNLVPTAGCVTVVVSARWWHL